MGDVNEGEEDDDVTKKLPKGSNTIFSAGSAYPKYLTSSTANFNQDYNSLVNIMNGFGGKWSTEEDRRLREIVKQHGGKNWKIIATLLGDVRTDVQCLHRWNKVLRVRNLSKY